MGYVKTCTVNYGKGLTYLAKVAQSMLDADMVLFSTESIADIKQHVTRYTALLHNIQKVWPSQINHWKASTMTEGMGMLTTDTWQLTQVVQQLSPHVEKVRAQAQAANKERNMAQRKHTGARYKIVARFKVEGDADFPVSVLRYFYDRGSLRVN